MISIPDLGITASDWDTPSKITLLQCFHVYTKNPVTNPVMYHGTIMYQEIEYLVYFVLLYHTDKIKHMPNSSYERKSQEIRNER